MTPELGRILAANGPPLATCIVVAHWLHGAAARPRHPTSFGFRSPHLVLGVAAGPRAASASESAAAAPEAAWSEAVVRAISERGLALPAQYMSFAPPGECDAAVVLGGSRRRREAEGRQGAVRRRKRAVGGLPAGGVAPEAMSLESVSKCSVRRSGSHNT